MDSILLGKKINCTSYFGTLGEIVHKPLSGTFDRWADDIKYEDEKYYQLKVALMLAEDNKIYKVPPDSISLITS